MTNNILSIVENAMSTAGTLKASRKRRSFGMVTMDYFDFSGNQGTVDFRHLRESLVMCLRSVRGVKVKETPAKISRGGLIAVPESIEVTYPNDLSESIENIYKNHIRG